MLERCAPIAHALDLTKKPRSARPVGDHRFSARPTNPRKLHARKTCDPWGDRQLNGAIAEILRGGSKNLSFIIN